MSLPQRVNFFIAMGREVILGLHNIRVKLNEKLLVQSKWEGDLLVWRNL
jgi:hypothetical protein